MANIKIKGLVSELRTADQMTMGALAHDVEGNIYIAAGAAPNGQPKGFINLATGQGIHMSIMLTPLPQGAEVTLTNRPDEQLALREMESVSRPKRRENALVKAQLAFDAFLKKEKASFMVRNVRDACMCSAGIAQQMLETAAQNGHIRIAFYSGQRPVYEVANAQ